MSKIVINNTVNNISIVDTGITINASSQYTIPPQDYALWSASSNIITEVSNSNLIINDGSVNLSISDGINLIRGSLLKSERLPFASKKLPDGKSLFRRIHGIKLTTDGTSNSQKIIFTVPYNSAKITSTEIIGAELGDIIDFKILDTTSGTATGIPNYMLNQFGFGVYPSKERYEQKSEYDADLFIGLQLEITLTPVDTLVRDVYFNLVLHEVV